MRVLLKLLILCLINLNIGNVYSRPKRPIRRRRSNLDNSIFRNRTDRCIRLIENMEEMESLNQEPVNEEFDEVPIKNSEENLGKDVVEGKLNKKINKESSFRRFLRCLTGRSDEPVDTISYRKKEETLEMKKDIDEGKQDESDVEPKPSTSGCCVEPKPGTSGTSTKHKRTSTLSEVVVEPKPGSSGSSSYETGHSSIEPVITRKNEMLTGTLTEIGETRLPKTKILSVSLEDDFEEPGPSGTYAERMRFPTLEEKNMMKRMWFERNGDVLHKDTKKEEKKEEEQKDDKKEDKDRETRI